MVPGTLEGHAETDIPQRSGGSWKGEEKRVSENKLWVGSLSSRQHPSGSFSWWLKGTAVGLGGWL